ncbi:hypothetical protein Q2490_16785 [Myroides odoratimimus]|uniref:hypothetical protein n=1 Tax=Myroides odoratimimus TaxID=76832 RepID=UPI0026E00213|nr:hypothetical protein [Myroides odoratimimus]MDO5858934.1 hypothetical protein [Myroides odoratimimus]
MEYKETYEDRYTLFIDILGFKNIIGKSVSDGNDNLKNIIHIQDIYNAIYNILDSKDYYDKLIDKKVTVFSDCIVISFPKITDFDLLVQFFLVQSIILKMLELGILLRGAFTYGKLIHTDKYVFGPALVRAYNLENEKAIYPRIIIDGIIFEIEPENNEVNTKIKKQDEDGLYYVDYFTFLDDLLSCELNNINQNIKNIYSLRVFVESKLIEFNKNEKVKPKYEWMAKKINEALNNIKLNKKKYHYLTEIDCSLITL